MNWKEKLSSRKLWVAVAGFVGMMAVALGYTEEGAAKVAALIMAGASVVAYIVGQGWEDADGGGDTYVYNYYLTPEDEEEEEREENVLDDKAMEEIQTDGTD